MKDEKIDCTDAVKASCRYGRIVNHGKGERMFGMCCYMHDTDKRRVCSPRQCDKYEPKKRDNDNRRIRF